MKALKAKGRLDPAEGLGMALFALCAGVVLYIAFEVAPTLIESDAASDMLLARYAPFLSEDWYYANGLSGLNFQWLRFVLLRFIGDWGMVRSFMFVFMTGLVLLAEYYLLRQVGLGRREFWLTASVTLFFFILQPNEKQQYAMMLLYTFLAPALMLHILQGESKRGRITALAGLLLLALSGGISATRLLISLFFPLLLAAVLTTFLRAKDVPEGAPWLKQFKSLEWKPIALTLLAVMASVVGVVLGKKLVWPMYHVETATGVQLLTFVKPQPGAIQDVIARYFALFGYAQGVPVVSRMGLGNLCALLLGVLFPVLAILAASRAARQKAPNAQAVLFVCCACFMLIFTAAFPMLFTGLVRFDRYYLPACALFAVMLAAYVSQRPPVRIRQMLTVLALGLALCCAVLSAWLTSDGEARLTDRSAQNEMLAYLEEGGYTLGYAPYWHASVNTERTDGRLLIAPITAVMDEDRPETVQSLAAYRWLTPCHAFDIDFMRENGKLFLLLPTEEAMPREKWLVEYAQLKERLDDGDPALPTCTKVFENAAYAVYTLPAGVGFAQDGTLQDDVN